MKISQNKWFYLCLADNIFLLLFKSLEAEL